MLLRLLRLWPHARRSIFVFHLSMCVPHAHQAKKTGQPQNDKMSFFQAAENQTLCVVFLLIII